MLAPKRVLDPFSSADPQRRSLAFGSRLSMTMCGFAVSFRFPVSGFRIAVPQSSLCVLCVENTPLAACPPLGGLIPGKTTGTTRRQR